MGALFLGFVKSSLIACVHFRGCHEESCAEYIACTKCLELKNLGTWKLEASLSEIFQGALVVLL